MAIQRIKSCQRRGSAYLVVLGAAMMLATIGFCVLTIGRITTRKVTNANGWTEAGILAFSAVEYALRSVNNTTGWRALYSGDGASVPCLERKLGGGTIGVVFVDEDDGDLADQPSDPIRVYGIGRVRDATRVHSVIIQPDHGLEVLRMAIHAGAELQVKAGKELIAMGAPASSNFNVRNDEIIYGDVESLATSGGGMVTGTTTLGYSKQMPDSGVFGMYMDMATEIPYSGHLAGQVLGPNCNPWGPNNEDGLYYINTLGNDLDIEGTRIHGTLVVWTQGHKVRLENAAFLQSCRPQYPVLIVDGEVEMRLKSDQMDLSEAYWGVNFNPASAPYQDESDNDLADTYPNEVQGLVHVSGPLTFHEATRIRGSVICENQITIETSAPAHIIHDPELYENPPVGYADPNSPMTVIPGTWQWDAVPGV